MPLFKRKSKFNPTKFLSSLRMAEIRTRQCKNKTDNSIPCQISEIKADLHRRNIDDAKSKAEVLIKSEKLSAALDELDCVLVEAIERANLLVDPASIPDDFLATLSALLYATPRVNIKELYDVKKRLKERLGKEFVKEAMSGARVDPSIAEKFRLEVPLPILVGNRLESISAEQKKSLGLDLPSVPKEGVYSKAAGPRFPEIPTHRIKVDRTIKVDKPAQEMLGDKEKSEAGLKDELPSFEELSKRFDELKKAK